MKGRKNATLDLSFEEIKAHCEKITKSTPWDLSNCIDLNCMAQKFYVKCFEAFHNKEYCLQALKE